MRSLGIVFGGDYGGFFFSFLGLFCFVTSICITLWL